MYIKDMCVKGEKVIIIKSVWLSIHQIRNVFTSRLDLKR